MSWLSAFFRRDNVKVFLKLAEKILKMVIGAGADTLHQIAREEVSKAEVKGASGVDKYQTAFKGIRARLPEVRESAANLAIELAVEALNQARG